MELYVPCWKKFFTKNDMNCHAVSVELTDTIFMQYQQSNQATPPHPEIHVFGT